MKYLHFFLWVVFLVSCSNNTQPDLKKWSAYQLTPLEKKGWYVAERFDDQGKLLEKGYLLDGKKMGAWTEYNEKFLFPLKISHFINDNFYGPYTEFNLQGQVSLMANYKDNLLDGPWTSFRISRPTVEAFYKDGKLEGVYKEYDYKNGKLQKEIYYLNGLEDGPYRYYNPEGKITMEYIYKKGERISGGIVD